LYSLPNISPILFWNPPLRQKSDASFEVTHEGPDHDRTFFAEVIVDGAAISKGSGRTRKAAEAQAAVEALKTLRG
jgi:ribonuclease-3